MNQEMWQKEDDDDDDEDDDKNSQILPDILQRLSIDGPQVTKI